MPHTSVSQTTRIGNAYHRVLSDRMKQTVSIDVFLYTFNETTNIHLYRRYGLEQYQAFANYKSFKIQCIFEYHVIELYLLELP